MSKKAKTHGGKRKGAGRPPRAYPREAITVRVETEIADQLRHLCEQSGQSQSAVITRLIMGD